MSDHTPHHSDKPQRDSLQDCYRSATQHDGQPSSEARARILAYAQAQAARTANAASGVDHQADAAQHQEAKAQPRRAANDWRWLQYALGSMATIGVICWVVLQQLSPSESSQPVQLAEVASHSQKIASLAVNQEQDDVHAEVASTSPPSLAAASQARPPESANEHVAMAQPARIFEKSARTEAAEVAALPSVAEHADTLAEADQAASILEPKSSLLAQSDAEGEPASAPVLAAAPMPPVALAQSRSSHVENAANAHPEGARPVPPVHAAATAKKTLTACDTAMPADQLTEQLRLIQAQENAARAGQPLPAQKPVCDPRMNVRNAPPNEPASTKEPVQ